MDIPLSLTRSYNLSLFVNRDCSIGKAVSELLGFLFVFLESLLHLITRRSNNGRLFYISYLIIDVLTNILGLLDSSVTNDSVT